MDTIDQKLCLFAPALPREFIKVISAELGACSLHGKQSVYVQFENQYAVDLAFDDGKLIDVFKSELRGQVDDNTYIAVLFRGGSKEVAYRILREEKFKLRKD